MKANTRQHSSCSRQVSEDLLRAKRSASRFLKFNPKVSVKEEQHHLSMKPEEETEVMGVIFPSGIIYFFTPLVNGKFSA